MTLQLKANSYVVLSLITSDEQIMLTSYPQKGDNADEKSCSREQAICAHVIERGSTLVTSVFS